MRLETPERTVLRMRSAAGHLWAVGTWLEEGAEPVAVLSQLAAVQAALEAVRRVLVGGLVAECAERIRHEPSADVRASELRRVMEGLERSLGRPGWKREVFK
jgi:DNA-binding FrmR family transcriptional regulator